MIICRWIIVCVVVLLLPLPGAAQEAPAAPVSANPFKDFETIYLPNGLKVWYKRVSGDQNVSISVTIPYGSDHDTPGLEELAHFTEHMLFSDHLGRTEEQIKREIEDLGGVRNAVTYLDHTSYYARIDKTHGLFAIEWLYKIVSPHAMAPEVVERQREPVAVEVGAKKRELFDWIGAYYVNPPWLRPYDFWRDEFGMQTAALRDHYVYRSLYRITPEDLKSFYNTYYVPGKMTLAVIGDLDRDAVLKKINETFATLPARPLPPAPEPLRDPGRQRQHFSWGFQSHVHYYNTFKIYRSDAQQHVMLIFISRLLGKRLNDRLRFGDRKATYGIPVYVARRGQAMQLSLYSEIKPSEFEYARQVVEEELNLLRTGALKDEEFDNLRQTIARQLRASHSSARDLESLVTGAFYNPDIHRDFPDLPTIFEQISKQDVARFAQEHFVPTRQVGSISYINPLAQGWLLIIGLALLVFTVQAARFYLLAPINMSQLRYVARFHMPLINKIVIAIALLAVVAIAGRLLIYGYELLADRVITGVDSFLFQWSIFTLMGMFTVFLLMLLLSRLPTKIMIFTDKVVIKHLTYRSVAIPLRDIAEISRCRGGEVWLTRRLWKCLPLTLSLFSPGIYLRDRRGWCYFFRVRNCEEFLQVLNSQEAEKSARETAVLAGRE